MADPLKLKVYSEFPHKLIDETQVPIFSSNKYANYLKSVHSLEVVWFSGFLKDKIVCVIPFYVVKKIVFKKGVFLTAVVTLTELGEAFETEFMEMVIQHIRKNKFCDWIQQPPNWAIFKTVPSNSIYCEFSTHRIDLKRNDSTELLKKMYRDHRQHIKQATNDDKIIIKKGPELLNDCIKVFSLSKARNSVKLPSIEEVKSWIKYLPEDIHIYVSYFNSDPQSCVIYFSDQECFYAVYAAMVPAARKGINHLLHWQAILDAKLTGAKYYDFVGSRISPAEGSKPAGLKHFKSHFGGNFVIGYLWKLPLSKAKYYLYCCLTKLIYLLKFEFYKGDIIDQELKRLRKLKKYDSNFNYIKPDLLFNHGYAKQDKESISY